jgi:hypothetical protein
MRGGEEKGKEMREDVFSRHFLSIDGDQSKAKPKAPSTSSIEEFMFCLARRLV